MNYWNYKGSLYGTQYIGQAIYRLTDITFSMLLFDTTKFLTHFNWQFIWVLFFCKQQDMKNDQLLKKWSCEWLNFDCSNLPDAYSVEFTNHLWRTKNWQHHSFISEAKSSNIVSMPKVTGCTFGLPTEIDFITSKCRCTIL